MRVVAKQDFDAVWVPRIGEQGTRALRHFRRIGFSVMATPLFAGAAGVLIGTTKLGDVLGVLSALLVVSCLTVFFRAQGRLAAALSDWYGVKVTGGGIPKMYPKRFDSWCQERGLVPCPKLRYDERVLWSGAGSATAGWRPITGTLYVTSERIMFVPARFGSITTPMPKVEQFIVDDFQSVGVTDQVSTSSPADKRQVVAFTFGEGEALKVTVVHADKMLTELQALLHIPRVPTGDE